MKKIMLISFIFFITGLLVFPAETAVKPAVKMVGDECYAYMEFTGPYDNMQEHINTFMAEFFNQKLVPAGSALTMYLNSPSEVKPEELKWTFGFIVDPRSTPKEPIKKMELKKHLAVVYLHKGPYSDLGKAYEIAWKFIKDNGYHSNGAVYDKYLNNPMEVTPENLETEIVIPVEPLAKK